MSQLQNLPERDEDGQSDWDVLLVCVVDLLRTAGKDGCTEIVLAAVLSQARATIREAITELGAAGRVHWTLRDGITVAWAGPLVSRRRPRVNSWLTY
jgi:hypothetical protein